MVGEKKERQYPSRKKNSENAYKRQWIWAQPSASNRTTSLRWRITIALLLVSLIPLMLVGIGAWHVFHRLSLDKTFELHHSIVERHAGVLNRYLSEKLSALELISKNHTFEVMANERHLTFIFEHLRSIYPSDFIDMGVIDSDGNHRAYIGPYDLKDKNYKNATWFHIMKEKGSYVSDIFLGLRKIPHSVIAVINEDAEKPWILRATINSERLYSLVRSLELGETTDVFIINRQGKYQTPARAGHVLEQSNVKIPCSPDKNVDRRVRINGEYYLQVSSWINQGRWLLVVQKAEREIVAPVRRAMIYGELVVLTALIMVFIATFFATTHLTGKIDEANRQRDAMYKDLMRSAKLASLGEIATGFAHEINNPLATICAEQTNISDTLPKLDGSHAAKETIASSVDRCHRQIKRCSDITRKMLQFGRGGNSEITLEDLVPHVTEAVDLLSKKSGTENIHLSMNLDSHLPKVLVNATEFEQVLVNLINNSIHSIRGSGAIEVSLRKGDGQVELNVKDNGHGIPEKDIDKIFQPFFTTKPIGQGTGLGLSISYGLVSAWGGNILVDSQVDVGTSISVFLPIQKDSEEMKDKERSRGKGV